MFYKKIYFGPKFTNTRRGFSNSVTIAIVLKFENTKFFICSYKKAFLFILSNDILLPMGDVFVKCAFNIIFGCPQKRRRRENTMKTKQAQKGVEQIQKLDLISQEIGKQQIFRIFLTRK